MTASVTSSVRFYPERLDAAILRAFSASLVEAAAEANVRSGTPEATAVAVQTGATSGVLRATGRIGAIREAGAARHEIPVRKGFLYIGNGRFTSAPVHHPGSAAHPYVAPTAAHWANGGFQRTAAITLRSSGF